MIESWRIKFGLNASIHIYFRLYNNECQESVPKELLFIISFFSSVGEYVKSSTILDLCDRIENKQREFAKLDDMLTELENAFWVLIFLIK